MAGINLSGTMGGGLLLAAATGFIAMAEEPTMLEPNAAVSLQPMLDLPPASVSEPWPAPFARVHDPTFTCPQGPTHPKGRFDRFVDRCRAKYWGFPEEFHEPPLGTALMGHYVPQVANVIAARMVLYQYDFLPASDQLSARGKQQVYKIAGWLPMNSFPILVEPLAGLPELDERRRQAVWNELHRHQCPIPYERVVTGHPSARGLDAGDALLIHRNRLSLTAGRGASASGGGAAGITGASSGTTGQDN